jgi:aryl-alcohol dehydrogenase-like predicted oxidoreductase
MKFSERTILGKTGLKVGRLGLASSYKAPATAFEEAFERGCNYFVWNTFIRGRSPRMRDAIRNIVKSGRREQLVIAMHCYGHSAAINRYYFLRSLKTLGVDYIDIMLLGYHPRKPAGKELEGAMKLREQGLTRFIGITGHNQKLFPQLDAEDLLDVFHVRYNAVNRGAEIDVFPLLKKEGRAGIVTFTATRWGQLLNPKKMPEGESPVTAADCYRFALSHPAVDVCLTAPSTLEQLRENLCVLDLGPLDEEEMTRIRRIGDYIYGKKRDY